MKSVMLITALVAPALAQPVTAREPVEDVHGLGEVFFAFDSARLPDSGKLGDVAQYARQHPQARIVLDGNADSAGASPYNVGLALRRAESVQRMLTTLGVDGDRIVVVSYGEDGIRRTTPALDRRVTIWASTDPLYSIIDTSLVRGTAVVWRKPVAAAEVDGPRTKTVATR